MTLALTLLAGPTAAQPLIALIDSGVDQSHPALAGRVVTGYDFVDGDSVADDRLGHGTGVAGIIAGGGRCGASVLPA
jgi:subtilisin family serine protease